MEVRKGYKKTEVGVIPEDWDCIQLGNIGDCIIGLTYKPSDVKDYGRLVLRSSNINENRLVFTDNVYVDIPIKDDLVVQENDILICVRNGSRNLIGKCALIDKKSTGQTFGAFMSVFRSIYGRYLFNCFQSSIIKKQLNEIMGATINQITNKDLKSFYVPLPNNDEEQQAIAEALSDVDAVVSSLTKLINKKKNIKQGAMKELLTGKKRLEGFTGEWGKVRLGDVGKFISGSGFPLKYQSSKIDKYPFYKVSDFNNVGNGIYMKNANNYINEDVRITLSAKVIPKNAIIFAKIGAAIFLERKRIALYECCIDNNMMCFVSDSSILNEKFAYYIFQNNNLSDFNNATALPSLNAKAIGELAILVPPTVIEQTAIANILSDMDAEIEALEQKLSKYKAIKQGMMHELLNGRIRLI